MGPRIKMKSFKEFEEAMTAAQRQKAKATFRKNKGKIMIGRKKAAKKLASKEKLQKRAEKQARNILVKKLLKKKDKGDLSFAARGELEKRLAKKKGAIKKIAKKLLPQVKKADRNKLKKKGEDK
jgi:ATP sulfurylase